MEAVEVTVDMVAVAGGSGYIGGTPEFSYNGTQLKPYTENGIRDGNGFAKIEFIPVEFIVESQYLGNNISQVSVSNIVTMNSDISHNWKVKYKKNDEEKWETSNNLSFIINGKGFYKIKLVSGNIESVEKEIAVGDYIELDYIESTGTQYIDTNLMINQNTGFEIDFSVSNDFTTSSGWGAILGTTDYDSSGTHINRLDLGTWTGLGTSGYIYFGAATQTSNKKTAKAAGLEKNKRMNLSLKNCTYTNPSGTESIFETDEFTSQYSLIVFARRWVASTIKDYSKVKLYSLKLYDGNTVVRNYIPVYNTTTNSAGLYDKVEGKFYGNNGTGSFIVGPEKQDS